MGRGLWDRALTYGTNSRNSRSELNCKAQVGIQKLKELVGIDKVPTHLVSEVLGVE